MTTAIATRQADLLWILLFTIASTLTTLIFACATPFPALAALAAVHLDRRDGVLLMLAAWAVSQAIGFCALGYPWDAATALTGVAIGTAAIAGALVASVANRLVPLRAPVARLAIAYVLAFATFKLGILLWAPAIGHTDAALSLPILQRQFVRYAAILAGFYALYRVLIAVGVPAPDAAPRTVLA
ncbi:hypothetical protein [Sphingomonas sp. PAMC 26605]|uniref:hypothetical protein n=1 Tax=Sphingomonas sp. PAMC 26605 TaxID=1112214 RepID=UPI00026CCB19|nr:hypothetical protein [Sphingomonas sp. PAMC 26605]